jgi:hypothetical protein
MVKVTKSISYLQISRANNYFDLENPESVERFALLHGFYRKEAKKITAYALLKGFYKMIHGGTNCLRLWCLEIGILNGCTVEKSSLHDRLGPNTVDFLEAALGEVMGARAKQVRQTDRKLEAGAQGLLKGFRNVLIGDSTCTKLPSNLAREFPSSYSHGTPTATLRVQTIYNYTLEIFERFELGSFRDNDQGAADLMLRVACAGDLVLRDLGYFVIDNLRKLSQKGVFYISKYQMNTHLIDPVSGKKIDLISLFKCKNQVDMQVFLGSKEKLPVRLVAKKLPQEVARQRREKARKDRNKKTNHSEEYYELLGWVIFVTNVPVENLTAQQVMDIYPLRWFIEVIFKAWKSHFRFAQILGAVDMNYWRILCTIYLLLIKIAFWSMEVFQYVKKEVAKLTQKPISILKYFDVLSALTEKIAKMETLQDLDPYIPQFAVHATYEKRKKRNNIKELYIC